MKKVNIFLLIAGIFLLLDGILSIIFGMSPNCPNDQIIGTIVRGIRAVIGIGIIFSAFED